MSTRLVQRVPTLLDAWLVTRGAGAVVAVVDEGVEVGDHPEFADRLAIGGSNKAPAETGSRRRQHGANVAGLAVAGGLNVSGMAPEALLLPIAVPSLGAITGDPAEADGIRLAADGNADVICCAWAPRNPTAVSGQLPAHTRAAIDYCLTRGRGGNGCVIVFSAGNDGTDLALNGYASHPGVITVGACNCHGRHPSYSGYGDALWCVFPSNDPGDPVGASMTYITTAPVGSLLDGEAYYSSRFGFTSAATAAVAGICALIVSANPDLTASEVKGVLRDACEKIDLAGGAYDDRGHSQLYGYGQPDVLRAVELARVPTRASIRQMSTENGKRIRLTP